MSKRRMAGVVPQSRRFCWVKNRVKARNLIGNVLRAVRAGNCQRAERIIDSYQYSNALECASYATRARVHRKVSACLKKEGR